MHGKNFMCPNAGGSRDSRGRPHSGGAHRDDAAHQRAGAAGAAAGCDAAAGRNGTLGCEEKLLLTVSPLLFANLDMMGRQGRPREATLQLAEMARLSMERHILFVRLAFATFRQEGTARRVAHPVAIIRRRDTCAWSPKKRPAICFVPLLWRVNVCRGAAGRYGGAGAD